ncbi:MAG: hypothetical protein U1E65_02500 [Myxococcota bacterium]
MALKIGPAVQQSCATVFGGTTALCAPTAAAESTLTRLPGLAPTAGSGASAGGIGAWSGLVWSSPGAVPKVERAAATAPYSLPAEVGLGAETIHRYVDPRVTAKDITVSVYLPLATTEFGGALLDMNAKAFEVRTPDRCIVGDGSTRRAFVGIDKRPGTPLDRWLDALAARAPRNADGSCDLTAVLEHLRTDLGKLMKGTETSAGLGELPWDKQISLSADPSPTFKAAGAADIGQPIESGLNYPVVPLERYLEEGVGYCLQKSLVAGFILEKLGFPYRIVQGANEIGPGWSSGHTWVEVPDGRVLDPTWAILQKPTQFSEILPERFMIGETYRFKNPIYPYLRD